MSLLPKMTFLPLFFFILPLSLHSAEKKSWRGDIQFWVWAEKDWHSQLKKTPVLYFFVLFDLTLSPTQSQFLSLFYHSFTFSPCLLGFILLLLLSIILDFSLSVCTSRSLFRLSCYTLLVCLFCPHHHPFVIWSVELMALFPLYCHGDESCR